MFVIYSDIIVLKAINLDIFRIPKATYCGDALNE